MPLPVGAKKWTVCLFVVLLSARAHAQQTGLPSTAPTAVSPSVSRLPSANPSAAQQPSRLAVLWNGVQLQIEATNVALSAVLREVGQKTHTKITGNAPDERIFGSYGPGPLNQVVPALLDGLPLNLLLLERGGGAANELQLTSREGGTTPSTVPNQQTVDEASSAPSQVTPVSNASPGPNRNFGSRFGPGGNNGEAGTPPAAAANGNPGSDGTQPASPNGVRTPQEIFEQLQRLRSQQAQPQQ